MHIFIVNPISGQNKGLEIGKIIETYCKDKNADYKIYYTTKKNDATEIASLFKSEKDIIYSVGGDGTLNEVINGMYDSKASLQIIPVGTGNDFYRSITENNYSSVDLGKVNGRYFINVASVGFDAEVADLANKLKETKVPNKMIYYVSLLKTYFNYKNIDIYVNNLLKSTTILTVCNAKYYGGGFKIAPYAELNDGLFDVYQVENLNKLKILKLLIKLVKEEHTNLKDVDFYRSETIDICSLQPLLCNVDGEIIKDYKFNFSIKKDAIKLYNNDELNIKKLLKKGK